MVDPQHEISDKSCLKETLVRFLEENQAVFLQHAGSRAMPDSFGGIHQMRVATKRLRSLFRWMEWLAPEQFEAGREMQDVRRYFKAAGKVRDLQMRERMLDGFCDYLGLSFPRYSAVLREMRLKAQKKLKKRMPAFRKEMLTGATGMLMDLLGGMTEEELLDSARRIVKNRCDEVRFLLPTTYLPDRYHKVRTILKENLYVMSQVNDAVDPPMFDPAYVDAVKEAGERGGDWHDFDVFTMALVEAAGLEDNLFPDQAAFDRLHEWVAENASRSFKKYKKQIKKVLEMEENAFVSPVQEP